MTLTFTSWNVVEEPLNAGDTFTVNYTVQNTSAAFDGGRSLSVRLSANDIISTADKEIGQVFVPSISPFTSISGSATFTLPDSSDTYWSTTDNDYAIGILDDNPGSAEFDDYDTLEINSGRANLIGTSFNVREEPRNAGDTITVDFTIENQGTEDSSGFTTNFRLSSNDLISTADFDLGNAFVSGIAAGESVTLTRTFTLPDGSAGVWDGDRDYYVGMRVDAANDVLETDEGDNSNEGNLLDYDLVAMNDGDADLVGTSFNVREEPRSAGDTITVDFTIQNQGTSDSTGFQTSFSLSTNDIISTGDFDLGTVFVGGIDAGGSTTLTRTFTLPDAASTYWDNDVNYTVGMRIDSDDRIPEADESNNSNLGNLIDEDNLQINTGAANLVGVSFNVVEEPRNAGDPVTINYTIENTGTVATSGFTTNFRLSRNDFITTADADLGSQFVAGIAAGATRSGTFTTTLPDSADVIWDSDLNYAIGMLVDSTDAVLETDEFDNSNVGEFDDYDELRIDSGNADLVGTAFNVVPEPRDAGDTVTISYTIENQGTQDSLGFTTNFRLSSNDTISTVDFDLGNQFVSGLAAGASTTLTKTVTLPGFGDGYWTGGEVDGDFAIGMIVDADNVVSESNEANNSNRGEFRDYDPLKINDGNANLVATGFNVVQEPLNAGDSFDVTFTIANTGTSGTSAFDANFRLSGNTFISTGDNDLGTFRIGALDAGDSTTLTRTLTLPDSADTFWSPTRLDHTIGIIVDSSGEIPETNEADNRNEGQFRDSDNVQINTGNANLVGTSFNVVQEPLAAGDSFDVTFRIANTGTVASTGFTTNFRLSTNDLITTADFDLGDVAVGPIAAGSSVALTRSFTLPDSAASAWSSDLDYAIGMIVDSENDVLESDETDNRNEGEFRDYDTVLVQSGNANLTATSLDVLTDPASAGGTVDVTFTIENNGTSESFASSANLRLSTNDYISTGDLDLGDVSIPRIAAGGTFTTTQTVTLPTGSDPFYDGDGTFAIGVIVDSNDNVVESDETDNERQGEGVSYDPFTIEYGDPDLRITGFNVVQEPLNAGDTFDVTFTVANEGTGDAGAFDTEVVVSQNDYVWTGDPTLGTVAVGPLAAGASTTVTQSFTLPGSADALWDGDLDYFIGGVVDPTNAIAESDDTNNFNQGEFVDYDRVQINDGNADLVATAFDVVQEPLAAGDTFDITYTVQNQGTSDATSSNVNMRLSLNDYISTGDFDLGDAFIFDLAAGESYTGTKSFTLPDSSSSFWDGDTEFAIGMIVDSGNKVVESDEANNERQGLFVDYDTLTIDDLIA